MRRSKKPFHSMASWWESITPWWVAWIPVGYMVLQWLPVIVKSLAVAGDCVTVCRNIRNCRRGGSAQTEPAQTPQATSDTISAYEPPRPNDDFAPHTDLDAIENTGDFAGECIKQACTVWLCYIGPLLLLVAVGVGSVRLWNDWQFHYDEHAQLMHSARHTASELWAENCERRYRPPECTQWAHDKSMLDIVIEGNSSHAAWAHIGTHLDEAMPLFGVKTWVCIVAVLSVWAIVVLVRKAGAQNLRLAKSVAARAAPKAQPRLLADDMTACEQVHLMPDQQPYGVNLSPEWSAKLFAGTKDE
jgi:hypothetical protein